MSYIKFPMPGGEVGLKFGYTSYTMVFGSKNLSLMFDEEGNPTPTGIAKIIYSGYANNCVIKEIEATLTVDDFAEAINELYKTNTETLKAAILCWTESKEMKNAVAKLEAITEEKKSLLSGENISSESNLSATGKLE